MMFIICGTKICTCKEYMYDDMNITKKSPVGNVTILWCNIKKNPLKIAFYQIQSISNKKGKWEEEEQNRKFKYEKKKK